MDMHVHTMGASSDSMLKPEDLPEIGRANGLTGFNIAEHDQVWERYRRDAYHEQHQDIFANFGMEVSTDHGHILAIGLEGYISGIRRLAQLREEIDKVGGFLIVAHPFRHVFDPVTAMRKGGRPFDLSPEQAADLPVFKLVDAIEVANGCNTPRENEFAYQVAKILGKSGTGGSDAHSNTGIGFFATGFHRVITTQTQLLEELHAGRFEAVHRTPAGRLVKFEVGSIDAAQNDRAPASEPSVTA
ncbi:MAG TPA: CehA/McbA family metallohydrolase [Dehalococcoidia bacterium]|nr:CehA/McbA family metallohydrolase [Dehalococcoidia bacterium]